MSNRNSQPKTGRAGKRLSLWPLKPKDALETMLRTPLPGKHPRAKPDGERKAK